MRPSVASSFLCLAGVHSAKKGRAKVRWQPHPGGKADDKRDLEGHQPQRSCLEPFSCLPCGLHLPCLGWVCMTGHVLLSLHHPLPIPCDPKSTYLDPGMGNLRTTQMPVQCGTLTQGCGAWTLLTTDRPWPPAH